MDIETLKDHPAFGSFAAIAKVCNLSREAVRKWTIVPADYCPAIEAATNGEIRVEDLRPDVAWKRGRRGRVVGYFVETLTDHGAAA